MQRDVLYRVQQRGIERIISVFGLRPHAPAGSVELERIDKIYFYRCDSIEISIDFGGRLQWGLRLYMGRNAFGMSIAVRASTAETQRDVRCF